MRNILTLLTLLAGNVVFCQQNYFGDYSLQQVPEGMGRYFVQVKKKNGLWHRTAWYYPEKTLAREGVYLDEACTQPDGEEKLWHPNRYPEETREYRQGKPHGVWLKWNDEGLRTDSSNYKNGHRTGISYSWHRNGMLSDSIYADGAGNSVQVSWDNEGNMQQAGRWVNDTARNGRWQYFHANGNVLGTEDYQLGKRIAVACYDEQGNARTDCEQWEAEFPGGTGGWRRFLERYLDPMVAVNSRAPYGSHTVVIQFVVGTYSKLSDMKALTKIGYGLEEEALRTLRKSPSWIPAKWFGKPVKAYRKQPISFLVQRG